MRYPPLHADSGALDCFWPRNPYFLCMHLRFPNNFFSPFSEASLPTNRSGPIRSLLRTSSDATQHFQASEVELRFVVEGFHDAARLPF